MEVKEGIRYLDMCKLEDGISQGKNYEGIISLLQDLEKYRLILNELDKKYGHYLIGIKNNGEIGKSYTIRDFVRIIKRKYFPQPVKKVITIEVETNNSLSPKWLASGIKGFIEFEFNEKDVKVNIKEEKLNDSNCPHI